MASMSARLVGYKETSDALKELSASLRGHILADAALKGANVIVRDARTRAPRDTGLLAKSIVAEIETAGADSVMVHIGWLPEAFYGKYQELGTSHHAPQPHMRPAFDAMREEAVRTTAEEVKSRITAIRGYAKAG